VGDKRTAEAAAQQAGEAPVTGEPAGAVLLRLVAVMDTLRTSCPWDARQTHESLAPHLLEESYEALDALESRDLAALQDELGDVLLQVVFHARIAAERTDASRFTIDDVAQGIVAKLVRRHPHVFGDVTVSGPEEVKANWDAIKAAERAGKEGAPASMLDSVPFTQPALALTAQLQRRAERAGVPPEVADLRPDGRPAPAEPAPARPAPAEPAPARPAPAGPAPAGPAPAGTESGEVDLTGEMGGIAGPRVSDIGAELFALVAKAREAGLDPELELRAAARAYRERVRAWELSAGSSAPHP
jgi:XTP/dITP diphosphohydrolase